MAALKNRSLGAILGSEHITLTPPTLIVRPGGGILTVWATNPGQGLRDVRVTLTPLIPIVRVGGGILTGWANNPGQGFRVI
jgi:hypothetical protein